MFDRELDLIEDIDLRNDISLILSKLPEYFWKIPASSTGKYHPKYTLSEGGLIKHTKVAIKIANDLLNLKMFSFSENEKDLIYASLIIHDGLKYGYDYDINSYFKHPLYISEFIMEMLKDNEFQSKREIIIRLAHIVSTHMGQWNTSKYESTILPLPQDEIDNFVHMCDYLSSRRYLNVEFNDNYEII